MRSVFYMAGVYNVMRPVFKSDFECVSVGLWSSYPSTTAINWEEKSDDMRTLNLALSIVLACASTATILPKHVKVVADPIILSPPGFAADEPRGRKRPREEPSIDVASPERQRIRHQIASPERQRIRHQIASPEKQRIRHQIASLEKQRGETDAAMRNLRPAAAHSSAYMQKLQRIDSELSVLKKAEDKYRILTRSSIQEQDLSPRQEKDISPRQEKDISPRQEKDISPR
ncbi:hypothetical protein CONLIGDRAFT_684798 [Coniochaeta ligniaria NRRL 30616]|uniref:Uncharacterized protein n=1 Tax=Coniochaeta ligniaria NRRL 30616 TaxID=1408157 RepID=A0A1J7J4Z3_9PEZI|nr:hypothetical protein CONLIGDRAFT_684798 [Coniochaeta ligniaria NRRL 30616]